MQLLFDEIAASRPRAVLLLDGLVSLLRQWTLRHEFWREAPVGPAPSGAPAFCFLAAGAPRGAVIAPGAIVSIALFAAIAAAIPYGQRPDAAAAADARIERRLWPLRAALLPEAPRVPSLFRYAGTYMVESPRGRTVRITVEEGDVFMQLSGEPKTALMFMSETQFFAPAVANRWVEFDDEEDGSYNVVIIHQAGGRMRAVRQPG
jgi:hypothetical protein